MSREGELYSTIITASGKCAKWFHKVNRRFVSARHLSQTRQSDDANQERLKLMATIKLRMKTSAAFEIDGNLDIGSVSAAVQRTAL